MTNGQETNADTPNAEPPPANLFWLKALVGGLAAMMAFAMLVIIARIGYIAFGPDEAPPAETPIAVELPDGMSVDSIDLDGGRIGVLARTPAGAAAIQIYDIRSGAVVRRFNVPEAAKP